MNSAINWLSINTPLTFAIKSSSNSNFVKFNASTENNSLIGMTGGEQLINLTSDASVSTAIHEILHACGIHHEMGRNDRDNYVTINTSNIYPNKMHNFNKVGVLASVDVGLFDSRSIMMYPSKTSDATFAKNINQNIITANNSNVVISPSWYPTTTDLLAINMLYGNEKPYLDYTVTYNRTYDDPQSGSYDNEVICKFTFYTDQAKTIPYIKGYPVPVVIEYYYEKIVNRFPEVARTFEKSVLIPAGENSFYLYGNDNVDRQWGDIHFLDKLIYQPKYPSTHYR
ncbi:M12 family metallopeptidase [Sphingobacterium sp. ML3W]|uniref:M12 family metallopeptidase n=1 Tax=Sphingobacterium sp. ML3W TaxID=1538644 RepID=UPI001F2C1A08|nr:M12 family metallopeptidase [Sphingobacterium sp. ML3W]